MMRKKKPVIQAFGDHGLLVRFGDSIDPAINDQVHLLALALRRRQYPWLRESVPGYASLLIFYDLSIIDLLEASEAIKEVLHELPEAHFQRSADHHKNEAPVEVPVFYGKAHGPDLETVAQLHHMTPQEVIHAHTQPTYRVYMIGFMPGFPYMGPLSSRLETPRLSQPRQSVEAGSVGIAGLQTGIYPSKSPGGWRILGRTPLVLFNPERDPPCLFQPGQTVRFYALDQ